MINATQNAFEPALPAVARQSFRFKRVNYAPGDTFPTENIPEHDLRALHLAGRIGFGNVVDGSKRRAERRAAKEREAARQAKADAVAEKAKAAELERLRAEDGDEEPEVEPAPASKPKGRRRKGAARTG